MNADPAPASRGDRPARPNAGLLPAAPSRRRLLLAASLAWAAGAARARADAPRGLRPHSGPAAPFELRSLGGPPESLAASRGLVVLVHFFATWCEPCRPELASLDRLAADRAAAGLKVLAVDVAEPEGRLARFFAERPVRFPVLLDADRAVTRAWGVEALPGSVVLDRALRPRLAVRGDLDWQRPDVLAALDQLASEPGQGAETRGDPS